MKKKIFLDTDMLRDCDDAAALAIRLNLEAAGKCEIVGMAVSSRHPNSSTAVDVINRYFNREGIPIGAPKNGRGAYRPDTVFLDPLANEYPHTLNSNDDAPNAVDIYRQVLAAAEDGEITLVTIGYMTNVADLLESAPDKWSDMDGKTLVRKKVRLWICMGGNFPVDDAKDNVNFTRDMPAAYKAIREWPGEIQFVGREIGHKIFAGDSLRAVSQDNPVRRAYELHRGPGSPDNWNHHTADPTTVWYAVHGCDGGFSLSGPGYIDLQPNGVFRWVDDPNGRQRYLFQKMPRDEMAKLMDDWMSMSPSGKD